MQILDEGHRYKTTDGQEVQFIKRVKGELTNEGTTNEELLEILLDRTTYLDSQFPCEENKLALIHMTKALAAFNDRTKKRVAQGVESKDLAHVS